jgi:hypothetical protein
MSAIWHGLLVQDFARLQGVGIEQSLARLPDDTLDGRPST